MTIDKGFFLKQKWLEDLVKHLKVNPGTAMATYATAASGQSMLVCYSYTGDEVGAIVGMEAAMQLARDNWTVDDAKKWEKMEQDTRKPADNFLSLLVQWTTFTGLMAVLWTESCPYYIDLWAIREVLDSEEVHGIREAFTPFKCAQYIWMSVVASRSFFSSAKALSASDFEETDWNGQPLDPIFPRSTLIDIINKVQNAQAVYHPTFPSQWQRLAGGGGGGGGGTGGGTQLRLPPPPAGSPPDFSGGTGSGGPGERRPARPGERPDAVHPILSSFFAGWFERFGEGKLMLKQILTAGGKTLRDLPVLPGYTNRDGSSNICTQHLAHGRCPYNGCRLKHPGASVPDQYAEAICTCLKPGMDYIWRNPDHVGSVGGGGSNDGGGGAGGRRKRGRGGGGGQSRQA